MQKKSTELNPVLEDVGVTPQTTLVTLLGPDY